jgi:protein disulfide-isomerase A1
MVSEVSLADVKDFSASDEIVMLMHLSKDNESLFQRMEAFALQYYDRYSFGATFTADPPKVVCYNNIDGTRHVAEHLESLNELQRLLARCVEPLISALTRRNEVKYLSVSSRYPRESVSRFIPEQGGKSLVYYFNISEIARKAYTDEMNTLAKTYQEYLTLVTVDSGEYPAMPGNLGLKSGTGLVVQNLHNGQAFPYEGDITAEKIEAFIIAISEGKVSAWDANTDQAGTVVRDEL